MMCPALEEKLIQTILRGTKNMESLKEAEHHGVVTIKQLKTAKSMPTQLVEIPELGYSIWAVRAFAKWCEGRKTK